MPATQNPEVSTLTDSAYVLYVNRDRNGSSC